MGGPYSTENRWQLGSRSSWTKTADRQAQCKPSSTRWTDDLVGWLPSTRLRASNRHSFATQCMYVCKVHIAQKKEQNTIDNIWNLCKIGLIPLRYFYYTSSHSMCLNESTVAIYIIIAILSRLYVIIKRRLPKINIHCKLLNPLITPQSWKKIFSKSYITLVAGRRQWSLCDNWHCAIEANNPIVRNDA